MSKTKDLTTVSNESGVSAYFFTIDSTLERSPLTISLILFVKQVLLSTFIISYLLFTKMKLVILWFLSIGSLSQRRNRFGEPDITNCPDVTCVFTVSETWINIFIKYDNKTDDQDIHNQVTVSIDIHIFVFGSNLNTRFHCSKNVCI